MVLGSVVLVVGVGVLVALVAALAGLELGTLYLPAMFMNSGNMLLPLSLFCVWRGGAEAQRGGFRDRRGVASRRLE